MLSPKPLDPLLRSIRKGLLFLALFGLFQAAAHAADAPAGGGEPAGPPAETKSPDEETRETESPDEDKPVEESPDESKAEEDKAEEESPDEGETEEDKAEEDKAEEESPDEGETALSGGDGEDEADAGSSDVPARATVEEAMVAVRGDARAGLGVIVGMEGRTVVLTTLSALDGSRRMVVNTAGGDELPIAGVVGAMDRDLALLIIEEGEWPTAELRTDPSLKKNEETTLFLPRGKETATLEETSGDRLKVKAPETSVYPGAPVVSEGAVVGVFSPERRIQGMGTDKDSKIDPIWPDGIVPVPGIVQWEAIDLAIMASEREDLLRNARIIRETGAFLKKGSGDATVSLQPLLSARDRLDQSLRRNTQEIEKEQARRSFIHTVRGVAGGVESDLADGLQTFYSYYIPEIEAMMELYKPIGTAVDQLTRNPRAADSFAR
ncbi:MAG: hypothetical protein ACLFSZ_04285 [Puniceicoccaceae bacterium]